MYTSFSFCALDSSSARFFNRAAPIRESVNSIFRNLSAFKKLETWLGLTTEEVPMQSLHLHETPFTSATVNTSHSIPEEEKSHTDSISFIQPSTSDIKQTTTLESIGISNVPILPEADKQDQFLSMFRTEGTLLPSSAEVQSIESDIEYILKIEQDVNSWTLKTDKPFIRIYLRNSTDYNADLPVVMTMVNLEIDAEPERLLEIMYDLDKRKKWDKQSVLEFVELERPSEDVLIYYMANKAPWPFSDRDFIDKRYIRRRSNGDIEIFSHHTNYENLPEISKKCERGKTIIAGQIIRRRIDPSTSAPTILFTLINQSDMGGKIPPKVLSDTLPASMVKWCKTIQTTLTKYVKTGTI